MSYKLPEITFVVSRSGDPLLFEKNFAASPIVKNASSRVIVQEGFSSAGAAYNDAIEKAETDLIVFAHQDVYLPAGWIDNLARALEQLETLDPDWGVLGGWGVNNRGLEAGFLYSVGLGILGKPFTTPVAIDTLDEYLLILRKSSGLKFDPQIPYFHFYGTDICMSARKKKKRCYAVPVFCVHNTSYGYLSPEFFACYWHVKKKWPEYLPIQTPCIRVAFWNEDLILRRFKHACLRLIGKERSDLPRVDDPRSVLPSVAAPFNEA